MLFGKKVLSRLNKNRAHRLVGPKFFRTFAGDILTKVYNEKIHTIVDGRLLGWFGHGADSDECGCAVPAVYAKRYVDGLL